MIWCVHHHHHHCPSPATHHHSEGYGFGSLPLGEGEVSAQDVHLTLPSSSLWWPSSSSPPSSSLWSLWCSFVWVRSVSGGSVDQTALDSERVCCLAIVIIIKTIVIIITVILIITIIANLTSIALFSSYYLWPAVGLPWLLATILGPGGWIWFTKSSKTDSHHRLPEELHQLPIIHLKQNAIIKIVQWRE